ncbi:MAG: hypothetical protein HJJLKODD_00789 [Phycisphaerae bacterium]|nr:hypothetical protein [Phycisphaerae bacterium]
MPHNLMPTVEEVDFHFGGFAQLMPFRVQRVLLVSSLYESFILEEDGLLNELIVGEYLSMNLSYAPRVVRVSGAEEALEYLAGNEVDLVITMMRLGHLNVRDFAGRVKALRPGLAVVVLATEPHDLVQFHEQNDAVQAMGIDRVFLWNGDAAIFLAIIKLIEDQANVEEDIRVGNVRVIILVENSIRFYSTYLPLIYAELMKLTQSLMADGINHVQRILRMRARPKILLAETFEQAWEQFSRYHDNVLGVISDVRFPHAGRLDAEAGLELVQRIKSYAADIPVVLQSADEHQAEVAARLGAGFVNKRSRTLLRDLRHFITGSMGFGDFVFMLPNGMEVGRAADLRAFEELLAKIPEESLAYHAQHNHISNWLMARTEFELASLIRPKKISDFPTLAAVRQYVLETLAEFREQTHTGIIADFSPRTFDRASSFTRLGGGSIGGKARGLAFVNALLRHHDLRDAFPGVRLTVPSCTVISTDIFESFMEKNRLYEVISGDPDDAIVAQAFLEARIPRTAHRKLAVLAEKLDYPLAVRSSSLLEDGQNRPFAGIYVTHMVPNNHPDPKVRLEQLCAAIKLVYASTFYRSARRYLEAAGRRSEEEGMGVIVQEVVGSRHGSRFYPTFSGVARSYNYYPAVGMQHDEGLACVALGLGKMVVEGGQYFMFSPVRPQILPQFSIVKDILQNSQRRFYALDLSQSERYPGPHGDAHLLELDLATAEQDGTLEEIGSVYSPDNDAIYDGVTRPGVRLVSFAHVLKYERFPLAAILRKLLELGSRGMASPVEIEFAADLSKQPMEFGFLQIRPIHADREFEDVSLAEVQPEQTLCYSPVALGNGRLNQMHDLIYVCPQRFDSSYTREIAAEIGQWNERLRQAGRQCILIGPGRWGTADRWLGIPVTWDQISTARAIVETALPEFVVAPSQGTHFFQNLTSLRIGYLTVNPALEQGCVDWAWLAEQPAISESRFLRHLRFEQPLVVKIDGRCRCGAILKPTEAIRAG